MNIELTYDEFLLLGSALNAKIADFQNEIIYGTYPDEFKEMHRIRLLEHEKLRTKLILKYNETIKR